MNFGTSWVDIIYEMNNSPEPTNVTAHIGAHKLLGKNRAVATKRLWESCPKGKSPLYITL